MTKKSGRSQQLGQAEQTDLAKQAKPAEQLKQAKLAEPAEQLKPARRAKPAKQAKRPKRPTTRKERMACCALHPAPAQFTIQTLADWSEVDQLLAVEQEAEPSWMDDPNVARYLAYGALPPELLRAKLHAEMKAERTHTEER